jgi:tetratricopeptide (TPR) repeat protein
MLVLPLRAMAAENGFEQGNRFYQGGQFAEAAAAYESQVRRGEFSANLFYNLANAYFRADQRGRAILNYQRALILEPAHAEATANLAFVRGGQSGAMEEDSSRLRQTLGALPIDDYSRLGAVSGWLAAAGLLFGALARRGRAAGWGLGFVMILVCAGCVGAVRWLEDGPKNSDRAIVLEDQTRALYAPADHSPLVKNLSVGNEVRVLAEQGAWIYAQLVGGKRGWLPSAKIEKAVPAAAGAPKA